MLCFGFSTTVFAMISQLKGRPTVPGFGGLYQTLYWLAQPHHRKGIKTLLWRHNERDDVSNHQHHECLLKRLFMRRSKKTSKFRVTGLCEGNSPDIPRTKGQ